MPESQPWDLELAGCTPEPLMNYLKALGVLRLVTEQKDSGARAWWKNDVLWLRSPLLFGTEESRDQKSNRLTSFFLRDYRPTPLLAPWNGGSGFYLKWDEKKAAFKDREACEALSRIELSTATRFAPYRDQIRSIKTALKHKAKCVNPAEQIAEMRERADREGWPRRKADSEVKKLFDAQMLFSVDSSIFSIEKVDKDELLCDIRSSLLNDAAIRWLDAAFVIRTGQKKNRVEAPLLGSGGNIGNSDFSARFMEVLSLCLALDEGAEQPNESAALLDSAIFGRPTKGLTTLAVDQFDPGRAGGANMHEGMEAASLLNPWGYILMLEGAVALQSASSRRFGARQSGSAFPFTVASTAAGFLSAGVDATRGEQWLPLWYRPSSASEIETLLGEGRAEVGPKRARTGVEFARAAASLGVDRGIQQFVRIQYQARFGDNYLANVVGRVGVRVREPVDLLREIDNWLDRFRGAQEDGDPPPRLKAALRRIDEAVFDACRYSGRTRFAEILCALGQAERQLAVTDGLLNWTRRKTRLQPLGSLSTQWIAAANDGSVEFELALALAGIRAERKIDPLRANLEPVSMGFRRDGRAYVTWAEKNRTNVWNAAELSTNLAAVLERRMIDGERAGCTNLPLASQRGVSIESIAMFLAGAVDETRIAELLWGLLLLDHGKLYPEVQFAKLQTVPLPRVYALLKPLFLPKALVIEQGTGNGRGVRLARRDESGVRIAPEQRVVALLRAGRVDQACKIAALRLRGSGLAPMHIDWTETGSAAGLRLAAALLIPIHDSSLNDLLNLVTRSEAIAQNVIA